MRKRVLQLGLALLAATRVGSASAGEIHDAVLVHDIERVRQLLLEKPALVNERTEKGDTPLYIAAFRGYVKQMVPLLLQFGADPNPPPNLRMETPLSIARELNMKQTAAMLLKAGAREDDISRAAELRYFAMKRDADALTERLNQNRRLVNSRNAYGQTPLAFVPLPRWQIEEGLRDASRCQTLCNLCRIELIGEEVFHKTKSIARGSGKAIKEGMFLVHHAEIGSKAWHIASLRVGPTGTELLAQFFDLDRVQRGSGSQMPQMGRFLEFIQRGHRLLLLGAGAGLSLGGVVLEY